MKIKTSGTLTLTLITLVLLLSFSCNKKPERVKPNPIKELKEEKYSFDNPPKFRKDGELHFISKETQMPIAQFDTEIVTNDYDRALGLMFRSNMENNQAMLFVFEYEDYQSFWMRNTIISLDMIFLNRNKEIVTIHRNTPTLTDQSFPSTKPAMYVVEVMAGTCDNQNINIGDIVKF